MATAALAKNPKESIFEWEGKDRNGKVVRGEIRAGGEAVVSASLRRQGILITKIKKRRTAGGRSIKQKDIAIFTRQLATMMKAGVPLLQSFDIVGRGSTNPRMTKLLNDIRSGRRDRHQPVVGLPQAPAALRLAVLQPRRSRRGRRHPGGAARPPGDLPGKDAGHQEQDQVGADVPDRGDGGGLRGGHGDHDLRDPGLQGGLQVLRRRTARRRRRS
jgi:hypothetical protein